MKTYVYIAKRNKKGLQLLLNSNADREILPIRVEDIKALNLPKEVEKEISDYVHQKRMDWELWIETAESFHNLRQNLKARGYSNLPLNGYSKFKISLRNATKDKYHQPLKSIKKIKQNKTMIKKRKN